MLRFIAAGIVASLLLTGTPCHLQAQAHEATCSFHGRIYDSAGAVIGRAFVIVHNERRAETGQRVPLDQNGEFVLQLKPGMYDFFVASGGFIPYAKKIDLRACKPVELKVWMKVDQEHLED